jgi:hypothetical protein
MQVQRGVRPAQMRQERRQHVGRDGRNDAQMQRPAQHAHTCFYVFAEIANLRQNARRPPRDFLARRCQLHIPVAPLDQFDAKLPLKILNCVDNAGCVTAQCSAARRKCRCRARASK